MNSQTAMLVGLLIFGSARAFAADVAITYSLNAESTGGQMSRGRIALQLTNVSSETLDDVSVRAVLPGAGHVTGPVLDAVDLGVGETVAVQGDYTFDAEVLSVPQAIAWSVSYRAGDGSVREQVVVGLRQD